MQHGLMGHGLQVYEEQVRIPMVFRMPGVLPAGSAVGAPIEMIDVAPTLLDLSGVPPEEIGGVGRSLAAALRGGPALPADHPVYLYRRQFLGEKRGDLTAQGEKFGVREGRWKYVVGPEEKTSELFDLESDPGEKTNVYRAEDPEAQRLAARIARWRDAYDKGGGVPALSDEARKGLEALGYVQ